MCFIQKRDMDRPKQVNETLSKYLIKDLANLASSYVLYTKIHIRRNTDNYRALRATIKRCGKQPIRCECVYIKEYISGNKHKFRNCTLTWRSSPNIYFIKTNASGKRIRLHLERGLPGGYSISMIYESRKRKREHIVNILELPFVILREVTLFML